jgi:predicted Zn finger-like uncharacterized protein
MIIQCDQCKTKFKLDDSKVAEKDIKVRCAKCRHVFAVAKVQPAADDSASLWQDENLLPTEAEQESAAQLQEIEPEAEPDDQFVPAAPVEADDLDFSFPSVESEETVVQEESQEAPDEMDFGAFDFGDEGLDAEDSGAKAPAIDLGGAAPQQAAATAPAEKEFGGLDFSGDDMFGEVVSTPAEDESKESVAFDMGMDDFSDSMGVESGGAGQGDLQAAQDTAAENPFSLDDIDFGDELTSVAVQQVSTEELKPSQEGLFAPLAAAETPFAPARAEEAPAPAQEEPAPLSAASRRKEGPRMSRMLMLLWAMIAGLVAFYSIWGIKTISEDKAAAPVEAGRITLRSVDAAYVKSKKLGTLLVISGEAVNEYNKPRASIQVKGMIFGADGEEVVSKSAFCGNPLTKEQLATMSMDKIEAAMTNQFGDSLANMEVAPGDSIPFVIVIPKPDKGATDYGVEPAGSTVATGKEKEK